MLFLPGATKSVGSNEFVLKTAQEQNRIKKIVEMKKNNPLKKIDKNGGLICRHIDILLHKKFLMNLIQENIVHSMFILHLPTTSSSSL